MERLMLYERIYNNIISSAKNRMNVEEYTEKHHIIPRCMGGSDEVENLVRLTYREHFICHQLLCKMYPNEPKLIYAFSNMIRVSHRNIRRSEFLTSKHFERVKRALAPYIGKWNKGRPAWNKGLRGEKYKQKYKNGGLCPPSAIGSKWINNGTEQKKLAANKEIPDGWVRGRISMRGENNPMRNKEVAKKNIELRKKHGKI